MVNIPGIENLNLAPTITKIMYYSGYTLAIIVMFVIFILIYYYMTFTIKAKVINLHGALDKGAVSIGRIKNNKFRWTRNKKSWKSLYPIASKKETKPFDPEFIYPGNQIFCCKYGDEFIPMKLDLNIKDGKSKIAKLSAVPHEVRNWQSLAHKINNFEHSEKSFWNENKTLVMGVITVAICCGIGLATVWLTYKFAGGSASSMNNLADSIRNMGVIPGK